MSFQNFKTEYYFVGGRHRSATKNIYGDITSKVCKVLIGLYSSCIREKTKTVGDNTNLAEHLLDFFKKLGRKRPNLKKKLVENVLTNPTRALDITASLLPQRQKKP